MRFFAFFFLLLLLPQWLLAQQEDDPETMELLATQQSSSEEVGNILTQYQISSERGLDINRADPDDLSGLGLNPLQVEAFFVYRSVLGPFIHVMELQAVPGWDEVVVRKILPMVRIGNETDLLEKLNSGLTSGAHSLMIRSAISSASVKSRQAGEYPGSPLSMMFRYSYSRPNALQFGFLGEKDAGEQFFRGAQKKGFDFYSAHFFLSNAGRVKSLALGDYVINMGQGLIHWQGISFGKGGDVLQIKKQAPFLRPYRSAGEVFFHRGAAVQLSFKKFGFDVFVSKRNHDARMIPDSTGESAAMISSLITSGYHRTEAEIRTRAAQSSFCSGMRLVYHDKNLKLAMNQIFFADQYATEEKPSPYQFFQNHFLKRNFLASLDHQFTRKNFHFFGELGFSGSGALAFLQGVIFSASHRADLSLLYRNFSPRFQSPYGRGFGGGEPVNENGIFAGLNLNLFPGLSFRCYFDHYYHPWLRYGVNAPAAGRESGWQLSYQPGKRSEIYLRVIGRKSEENSVNQFNRIYLISSYKTLGIRLHMSMKLAEAWDVRMRAEKKGITGEEGNDSKGWLYFIDLLFKPMMGKFSGNCRLLFHYSDQYRSGIYAFENDAGGLVGVRSFSGKGWSTYINVRYKIDQGTSVWLRISWSRSASVDSPSIFSFSREIRLQGLFTF